MNKTYKNDICDIEYKNKNYLKIEAKYELPTILEPYLYYTNFEFIRFNYIRR